MKTRTALLRFSLILLAAAGLSAGVLRAFGMWEAQARLWYLEGDKPGQAAIWGRYPNSSFGEAIAVGDVNGDGYDDLIADARLSSNIIQAGGEVYVIPGPLAFHKTVTMPQGAAIVFQGVYGEQPQIGTYLDSGDLNGDGLDDMVIGSWISGLAFVYLGSPTITAASPITIAVTPESADFTVTPVGGGLALCDFNGDGYQDLFVEEWTAEDGVLVLGLLGSSTLTMTQPVTYDLLAEADIHIQGFHPGYWGTPNWKNMACGDIDGDGTPDLAIGMYGESPSYRQGAGVVYVVRGDPEITHSSPVTITMPGQAGAIIEGVDGRLGSTGDQLGMELAMADVDQDGRADLIMGAPGASGPDNLIQYAGEVYLWLGQDLQGQRFTVSSQASWTVYGAEPSESLGTAIAAGDFDYDGSPEILLGCHDCARSGGLFPLSGRAYELEPLQLSGMMTVTAAAQLEVIPYREARCLGWDVGAMDLNGDGFQDLVMSAPCTDYPEGNLPGTVYAISYPVHFRIFLPLIR